MQKQIQPKVPKLRLSKFSKIDKTLIKRTGVAIVDTAVAAVDAHLGGTPLATGAWALAKALFGSGIALRQEKAVEWVEMIQNNPSIFTKEIVITEEFQDAFVTSLEGYIKERDESKRVILREIFKDYSFSKDPKIYPLERFNEITRQITIFDAKNFSYIKYLSSEQKEGRSFKSDGNTPMHLESVLHLVSLGLLIRDDNQQIIKENSRTNLPYIHISALGSHYYRFIEGANITYKK